jgi:hypothetical protein
LVQENRAKHIRSYSRLKNGSGREKEKHGVNCVDDELTNDEDAKICVAEWVNMPKPISCSFLKPRARQKDEMKYMFNVSKCDKLFDVLVKGGVIRLKEGHNILAAEVIGKRK